MSWEDIFKKRGPKGWQDYLKRMKGKNFSFTSGYDDEMPDWENQPREVELDESSLKEHCCEQARNQLLDWASSNQRRYEERGDKVKADNMEGLVQVIESESCDTIKETFGAFIGLSKVKQQRNGKEFSDTLKDLIEIIKAWGECESGN